MKSSLEQFWVCYVSHPLLPSWVEVHGCTFRGTGKGLKVGPGSVWGLSLGGFVGVRGHMPSQIPVSSTQDNEII